MSEPGLARRSAFMAVVTVTRTTDILVMVFLASLPVLSAVTTAGAGLFAGAAIFAWATWGGGMIAREQLGSEAIPFSAGATAAVLDWRQVLAAVVYANLVIAIATAVGVAVAATIGPAVAVIATMVYPVIDTELGYKTGGFAPAWLPLTLADALGGERHTLQTTLTAIAEASADLERLLQPLRPA